MERKVENIQTDLEAFLGSSNVYFQAPNGSAMKYPAIKYELSKIDPVRADNSVYKLGISYSVTFITRYPDDPHILDIFKFFDNVEFNTHYKSDGLNHYSYTLFY